VGGKYFSFRKIAQPTVNWSSSVEAWNSSDFGAFPTIYHPNFEDSELKDYILYCYRTDTAFKNMMYAL